MLKHRVLLKQYMYLSVLAVFTPVNCEIKPRILKLKFSKCVLNEHALRFYGSNLERCADECANRPGCGSLNYNRMKNLCEVNDNVANTVIDCPGMVFAQRSDLQIDSRECNPHCSDGQTCENGQCSIKECGPILDVDNADIGGYPRVVGSKIKYSCTTKDVAAIIECHQSGTWDQLPNCKVKSVGVSCASDSDCWEPNSMCIEDKCFCTYLARYDEETGTCKIECDQYAADFTAYPNTGIDGYNGEKLDNKTPQECQDACVDEGPSCGSIDYVKSERHCYLGTITYQQLLDADPSKLNSLDDLDTYSRHC